MADEIKMTGSLNILDGFLRESYSPGTISIDMNSTAGAGGSQTIGGSYEAIAAGDTNDGGVYFFRNVNNSIDISIGIEHGGSTFVAFLLLKPGEFSIGRLSSKTIFAKAQITGSVSSADLQYRLLSV